MDGDRDDDGRDDDGWDDDIVRANDGSLRQLLFKGYYSIPQYSMSRPQPQHRGSFSAGLSR